MFVVVVMVVDVVVVVVMAMVVVVVAVVVVVVVVAAAAAAVSSPSSSLSSSSSPPSISHCCSLRRRHHYHHHHHHHHHHHRHRHPPPPHRHFSLPLTASSPPLVPRDQGDVLPVRHLLSRAGARVRSRLQPGSPGPLHVRRVQPRGEQEDLPVGRLRGQHSLRVALHSPLPEEGPQVRQGHQGQGGPAQQCCGNQGNRREGREGGRE